MKNMLNKYNNENKIKKWRSILMFILDKEKLEKLKKMILERTICNLKIKKLVKDIIANIKLQIIIRAVN